MKLTRMVVRKTSAFRCHTRRARGDTWAKTSYHFIDSPLCSFIPLLLSSQGIHGFPSDLLFEGPSGATQEDVLQGSRPDQPLLMRKPPGYLLTCPPLVTVVYVQTVLG